MPWTKKEISIIRDLARKVAEIADSQEMEKRRASWYAHNDLKSTRPLIMAFPEGAWGEMLTEDMMACEDKDIRAFEWELRRRIYEFEHFSGDQVIEKEWLVHRVHSWTSWGLEPQFHHAPQANGAFGFDPVLKDFSDIKKLTFPELVCDEKKTAEKLATAQELLGDILSVKSRGVAGVGFHLMKHYADLRGMEQMYMDMYDEPQFMHEILRILTEGNRRKVQQLFEHNLLSLNNDNTYNNTGGNGYTHELPQKDCNPNKIRPCDMWAMAESQQLASVSPEMHQKFLLPHEKALLKPFGLTGYGCCEDLTSKLESIFTIPHIRRISISPWANVDACANKLKGNYIFSWKPNPAHLCGDFDPDFLRDYIRHTLEAAKANGCVLEIILKDTHTVENHPERIDIFTKIARDLITEYYGDAPDS